MRAGGEGVAVGLFDPQKYQGHQHTEALVDSDGVFRIYYKGIYPGSLEKIFEREREGEVASGETKIKSWNLSVSDFSLNSFFFFLLCNGENL